MTAISLSRLRALLVKELIQMRRDRVTFAMMLAVPLMQLMLFGYAINNDPKHLPAALVAPTQDRWGAAARPSSWISRTLSGMTMPDAVRLS